ncbi:MAG: AIM24 family protein [Cytophagales bacterium]|nr:MAG: AIM24 family protein [Cytophagales bacterium]TAF60130.1 MAG: AIM24 family protein [Cytophagales bacterium]
MSSSKLVKRLISSTESAGVKADIYEITALSLAYDLEGREVTSAHLNAGAPTVSVVEFEINNSGLLLEPGALHYMYGRLDISVQSAASGGGGFSGMFKRAVSGESSYLTNVKGTGKVFLEPTKGKYFFGVTLNNESMVADKGLFFAGADSVQVSAEMQSNVSAALFGGEGLFQTKVTGTGVVIFESPVPAHEIKCVEINNEKVFVDGNFAVLRTGGVQFAVEKSSKSTMGSSKSGEGLLQTFTGTGRVWLVPSQDVRTHLGVV